jgi:hypothetical protein
MVSRAGIKDPSAPTPVLVRYGPDPSHFPLAPVFKLNSGEIAPLRHQGDFADKEPALTGLSDGLVECLRVVDVALKRTEGTGVHPILTNCRSFLVPLPRSIESCLLNSEARFAAHQRFRLALPRAGQPGRSSRGLASSTDDAIAAHSQEAIEDALSHIHVGCSTARAVLSLSVVSETASCSASRRAAWHMVGGQRMHAGSSARTGSLRCTTGLARAFLRQVLGKAYLSQTSDGWPLCSSNLRQALEALMLCMVEDVSRCASTLLELLDNGVRKTFKDWLDIFSVQAAEVCTVDLHRPLIH